MFGSLLLIDVVECLVFESVMVFCYVLLCLSLLVFFLLRISGYVLLFVVMN